ncbi:aspartic proteinase nepenthesin-2-like [Juglans regia]|uniref:Aspartic proteinase nepenthesin-2-like n=1 Tax=Juglans regia TaxID=51240 RepID=A0A6P9E886_JUGRE|nr:aspartic proteinase nepenthesin-2-like [Juglans regia]
MAGVLQFLAASLFLYTLIITISQFHFSTSAKLSGLSLKIIPRDCLESPLYPGNLTRLERIERLIRFSKARAQYLETISSTVNSTILDNKNIRFTLFLDNFLFVVQVGIGLPEKLVFLLMDTGGGLIWTQCEPCKNYYKQAYPIYNSGASITYRKLPYNRPLCQGDSARYQCVNG